MGGGQQAEHGDWAGVREEDLPPDTAALVAEIGIEAVIVLHRRFGGGEIYFHKIETIFRKARNRAVRKEFDGANHAELARKYGITEMQIRNILGG